MVTETAPGAEVLDDEDLDLDAGFTATDEVEDDAAVDATAEENESDPLAELRSALETANTEIARLKALDPNKIGPAIGRVAALQSEIENLKKSNPAAELEPRLESTESLTRALASALVQSDIIDDASKAALRDALSKDETARNERALERRVQEAVAKVAPQPNNPAPQDGGWQGSPEADVVSRAITKAAQRAGIDPNSLPWAQASAMASLDEAEDFLLDVIAKPAPAAADRVTERKQAAGPGSPSRAGAGQTDMEKYLAWGRGEVKLSDRELRALEQRLEEAGEI